MCARIWLQASVCIVPLRIARGLPEQESMQAMAVDGDSRSSRHARHSRASTLRRKQICLVTADEAGFTVGA